MHLIFSENCSEGPSGGVDETANWPAWSRSACTYKAIKAPAEHRVQGWGRRLRSAGLSGKVPSTEHTAARAGGAKRTGGRLPRHQPAAAAASAAALFGSARSPPPRPPVRAPQPTPHAPAPPHSRPAPASPGVCGPVAPPYLAPRRPCAPSAAR